MSTISYIIPLRGTPLALRERCFASVRRVLRTGDELITIDDREAAEARNEGLRRATGDWVRFVDADDEIPPDDFRDELENTTADVILFGVLTRWGRFGKRWTTIPPVHEGPLTPDLVKTLNDNLLFRYIWNKIYRRAFLVEHQIAFECGTEPSEDAIFNQKCVLAGACWRTVPRVGYVYWKRFGSLTLSGRCPHEDSARQRENELWSQIDGCASCQWTPAQLARQHYLRHSPTYRLLLTLRRTLRFLGL